MDEFFALLNQVSVILLPILGAIALIYFIVLLKRVISVFFPCGCYPGRCG